MSIELDVMSKIKSTLLAALGPGGSVATWLVTVDYEQVRNNFSDYTESELPAIQVFDAAPATIRHQNRYIEVDWPLAIELCLKSSQAGIVDQATLFTRKRQIEDAISADLHLGGLIEGFRHLRYDGFETDLHSSPGYFAIALRMSALFQQPYPGG